MRSPVKGQLSRSTATLPQRAGVVRLRTPFSLVLEVGSELAALDGSADAGAGLRATAVEDLRTR